MRLTARCIFGTLLAVSSLSWITAASGEEDFQEDKGFEPCAATLTPEGPCKHEEETTCPYLVTLPLLTINLPMRLRELEQILEDLQKLKDNVDQLRKICADCTVNGVKGKGKLVQTQVPTAGKNEGRVEREEVVDKNHEETETDRNKVDNSKGSQE
uniref:Uncharacterized protein n=1 Tax=Sphaeramia orbicularis TaxID=375764 RepID=A0A672ZJN1_9TELE